MTDFRGTVLNDLLSRSVSLASLLIVRYVVNDCITCSSHRGYNDMTHVSTLDNGHV